MSISRFWLLGRTPRSVALLDVGRSRRTVDGVDRHSPVLEVCPWRALLFTGADQHGVTGTAGGKHLLRAHMREEPDVIGDSRSFARFRQEMSLSGRRCGLAHT